MLKDSSEKSNDYAGEQERNNVSTSDRISVEEVVPREVGEIDLYQRRERIYTRFVDGFYQKIRLITGWPLLVGYFLVPWIQWGDRQAVLFDLPARQFHIFTISFWPQDFPLLAWLLIIAAFALFAVTVFAGRVWCGYTCPQTIWTTMFMWIEQFTEGTRNQRMKLDAAAMSFDKARKKLTKHLMWFGLALATGVTFIAYFIPVRELIPSLLGGDAGSWAYAWALFFTMATYINAGWMREQICMYVCPYARFQSVMFDADTLIVSYDEKRGEPRGSRKMGVDPASLGKGDCIDCKLCVQVCPTGIDIRDGLQYECITCALCIDACDSMMDKMNYPRGLIRYTTENRLKGLHSRILRPRLIGYTVATLLMSLVFTYVLLGRVPLELDVVRQRGQLYHEVNAGIIENTFELKVMNMSQQDDSYRLSLQNFPYGRIVGDTEFSVAAGQLAELPLRVRAERAELPRDNITFTFVVESLSGAARAESESRFLSPVDAQAGQ